MVAVIYSDSDGAQWKLAQGKNLTACTFKTAGINPALNDEKYIDHILNKNIHLINYAEQVNRVYFFGAGTFSKKQKAKLHSCFSQFFKNSKIMVDHDTQAAALAVCGNRCGIVGILGSGSNAIYFDGKKVKKNNFGLGYILGDEGSSNWMGRILLKHYLGETLPISLQEKFKKRFDLDRKQILDKVYDRVHAVSFLSHFSTFLIDNQADSFIKTMVMGGFHEFFSTNILPLKRHYLHAPICLVGCIAAQFESWLHEVAASYGLTITSIIKEPIDYVLSYYTNQT
ncbi:MAG: hypothetical protein E6Q66_09075 [Pedobacter sp.]|jgi:N-acetylglucosamine kinase-like BadF-type ATPase|nr:MAG: hypothetical protein E6Q66_09075 [Pedobacter sp.]